MNSTIKAGPFEIPIFALAGIKDTEWGLVTAEQNSGGRLTVYWNNDKVWRGRVASETSRFEGSVSFRFKVAEVLG